ncbi:MAG: thioredoxin-dependent thiol peroxidase [candidate division WS1 bacterium]|jgi:peroxiredoxin Q/BCP|nr:thioredoxin-dependent thiol peroxidase [candidate division WS1 bacterium]
MSKTRQVLNVGDLAPDFTLPAHSGGEISLHDFRGEKPVVIYFYPRDNTPGCTKEACSFRDLSREFAEAGAVIFGVSPDSLLSHQKFAERQHLTFPLLSDEGGKVATQYGAYGEKSLAGRKYQGNFRITYLIDDAGKIAAVWPQVTVEGHADEVLAAVRELNQSHGGSPGEG